MPIAVCCGGWEESSPRRDVERAEFYRSACVPRTEHATSFFSTLRGARCAIKRKRRRAGCRRILFVLPTSQTGSGDGTPLVCLLTASVAPLFHRLLLSAAAMAVHLRDVDLVFLKKDARADVSFLYVFFLLCWV